MAGRWDDEYEDEGPSKSEMKRRMLARQALGERLSELSVDRLRRLELPRDLLLALEELATMVKHEARRRQMQFVGKLMRDVDIAPIEAALADLHAPHDADVALHKRAEALRDELVAGGDAALDAFCAATPGADRKKMGHLVRTAAQERAGGRPPKAYRELFRLLRGLLAEETI
ncbi:MAG: ribosome biogenesis factor YjgA [Desulfovibrionaceae bacterium]